MLQTKNVDTSLLEAEFYEHPFQFSYSGLNTLLTAPAVFYKEYILKQKDEEIKQYLLEGTIIHYLVLENQGFNDKFIVMGDSLPSDNNVLVAQKIFNEYYLPKEDPYLVLNDFQNEIDSILTTINLHQSVKDVDKRMAKIIEPRTEAYFDFLKNKGNKTIIDSAMLDRCTRRANIIKENGGIRHLLGMDIVPDGRTFGVYNELPISMEAIEGEPFGYRGILDNLVIDVRKKLVRINDFKTTSKSLVDFDKSVDFWNYWLQAAIYYRLVQHFLKKVLTPDWTIEFRFIVFDKYDQLYAFLVTPGTMENWLADFDQMKIEAKYHYESRDFSLPYDFAQGNVKL